jgi:hypothetical protein
VTQLSSSSDLFQLMRRSLKQLGFVNQVFMSAFEASPLFGSAVVN